MNNRVQLEELKIAALATGLRISAAALSALGGPASLTVHEYATTGGIPLRVGDVHLNVPFDDWFCERAEIELNVGCDGVLVLSHAGVDHVVDEVFPLPGYLGVCASDGTRYDAVAFSHMDRVRLSPIDGCAYDCAFCDMPGRVRLRSASQLIAAANVALADPVLPARHLLISGGTPGPRDQVRFADTVHELVETLSPRVPVDVMMAATGDGPALVDRLVDAGIHGFALNIEVASRDASILHLGGKHRRGRPYLDDTIAAAVERLGRTGRVRSLILPGLEAPQATLGGIEHLAALGADPVLSPFRPARNTKLEHREPVSRADLRLVLDEARKIVTTHGVALGPRCIPCQHNTLTFPWDVS